MNGLVPADEYLASLHEHRLLVFLESEDRKHFYQVHLDEQQFKKVSDAVIAELHHEPDLKEGYEIVTIELSEDGVDAELFNGMDSIYKE